MANFFKRIKKNFSGDKIHNTLDDVFGGVGDILEPVGQLLGLEPRQFPDAQEGPAFPEREDVVMQVLSEQLDEVKKKKGSLGGTNPADDSPDLALTTLAGF